MGLFYNSIASHFNRRLNFSCLAYHLRNLSQVPKSLLNRDSIRTLADPLPGFEQDTIANESKYLQGLKISKLSNGLTVASEDKFGAHCTVGVVIKSGPRFEDGFKNGVSHFIEKLAFQSTSSFNSRDSIQEEFEKCGAIFDCQIAKDITIYAISGLSSKLPEILRVLSEVVMAPRITPDELYYAKNSIQHELNHMSVTPPPDNILSELLHKAAFGQSGLGLPRYAPDEMIDSITREDILDFQSATYKPERIVLGGVGVSHENLIKAAENTFVTVNPTWNGREEKSLPPFEGRYIGGSAILPANLGQYHHPMPEFAHIVIGLESCGMSHKNFVPACLLNTLMGGGGSFSAGGPGKGMHSRLYNNVLNRYHWVNSALATNHVYQDTGVFAISASSEPEYIPRLVEVVCKELVNMGSNVHQEELDRAKKQLQSMLLMNLEFRAVVFEDLARQVLHTGDRKSSDYWIQEIDRVTAKDLKELVQQMLQSPPSVVGFGQVTSLPQFDKIQKLLSPRLIRFF